MRPTFEDLLNNITVIADEAEALAQDAIELAGYEPGNDFDPDRDGSPNGVALSWSLARIAEDLKSLEKLKWLREAMLQELEGDRS